jgi:hypothetical protein
MDRRAFLLGSLLATTALSSVEAASVIQVIYVGGWDCPWCTVWKRDSKAAWLASPESKRVTYTEIDSPKLREAYQERFWPGELKNVLDQLPRKSGTPRFIVVRDGKVISNQFGSSPGSWQTAYADLKKALAT